MITETQPCIIVLQLDDKLQEQLQPFLAGLEMIATNTQRLTMRAEVYEALATRVGSTLDNDIRWRPNEYEPDGFLEHVRPLSAGMLSLWPQQAACAAIGAGVPSNRVYAAARAIIEQHGLGQYFIHHTGHGLGLLSNHFCDTFGCGRIASSTFQL